jgi:hypothetical protein
MRRHGVGRDRVAAAQAVLENLLQLDLERAFATVADNQFGGGRLAENDALRDARRDIEFAPTRGKAFQQQPEQQARRRHSPQVRPGIVLPLADDS